MIKKPKFRLQIMDANRFMCLRVEIELRYDFALHYSRDTEFLTLIGYIKR